MTEEVHGRRIGVARVRAELLDPAELAGVDELLSANVAGVEAAHETELDRSLHLPPEVHDSRGLGKVERDRLLAPDRLAGPERLLDQHRVGAGRGYDDNRLHVRVVDRLRRVRGGTSRPGEVAALLRGLPVRVGDDHDVRVRDRCHIAHVRLAHSPGAEDGDPNVVRISQCEPTHALDTSPAVRR